MSRVSTKRNLPVMAFATGKDFEAWLAAQPPDSQGLWLKLAKKSAGVDNVSRQEAIDAALCHGWIDGQLDKLDSDYWLVCFTPRRARSKWSEINRTRATQLLAQGRVSAAGLKEIERAKSDGRWSAAYASQSTATVPDDLQAALDRDQNAKRLFNELDSRNRYAILHRVQDAKKPETRAQRIQTYVAMLSRGETIYPRKAG